MNDHDRIEFLKRNLDESLTIGELIELLSKYPKEKKIIATWEGCYISIRKKDIYLSLCEKFIFLDADYGHYKEFFANDPKENEKEG